MIGQLLQITTTPISLDIKITRAKLEYTTEKPSHDVTRSNGGLSISRQDARVNMDATETRASLGWKGPLRATLDMAQESVQAAQEGITRTLDEGSAIMYDKSGSNLMGQFAFDRMLRDSSAGIKFLPSVPTNISVEPARLDLRYEMDRLNFDWRTHAKPESKYTPAQIEFLVKEYPKVEIKYIGKPIYCPPSAEPGYQAPELDITA